MLKRGFILEVVLLPRVSVTLAWAPSVMSLAASVAMIATVISSLRGIASNAKACAESCNRFRCLHGLAHVRGAGREITPLILV